MHADEGEIPRVEREMCKEDFIGACVRAFERERKHQHLEKGAY